MGDSVSSGHNCNTVTGRRGGNERDCDPWPGRWDGHVVSRVNRQVGLVDVDEANGARRAQVSSKDVVSGRCNDPDIGPPVWVVGEEVKCVTRWRVG